ncbi:hypothetical protein [Clostridium thermarum]|uniref:hypothetical protein n=2 Tax=Clostridium thermarum TaxID=1716543 RepID=UPI001123A0F1|nr:hypothetical protein [Clostridium thermarum]
MSVFKNIHMKFWQNDFVLGLTAEERYFYIYLITNSMTNQCGIYRFNRRLAELETGLSCDQIEAYLKKFEEYGKIIVSRNTIEIMIVNWFKHNFKANKKMLLSINNELKDVKDKELLKHLYDFCCKRQYPIDEIFKGIIFPDNNINTTQAVTKSEEKFDDEVRVEGPSIFEQQVESLDLSPECNESIAEEDIGEGTIIASWNFFNEY